MFCSLPKRTETQVMGKQALRPGTSVAANFREASRACSPAEFVAKLGIVEQELDETQLWLELLVESGCVPTAKMAPLRQEADELLKITIAAIKNVEAKFPKVGHCMRLPGLPNSAFRIPN